MRFRGGPAAILAALISLAPLIALPATALAAYPQAKVVIVVGAVESTTSSFRTDADTIYNEVIKYTSNVTRIYSPNATWAKVKAAAQGANIFIYLGHGYGFPSPYRPVLSPSVQDGMGLNEIGGISDSDKKYYGETSIGNEIRLAKNAVVLLNHLCYSAGSSESGDPEPTIPVARQRVDNFASGWIKAGARMVMADSWTSAITYTIRSLFTTDQTLGAMWSAAPNRHAHELPFTPVRNPQFQARLDPDTWTTGFHRSVVGALGMRTSDVMAGVGSTATSGATTADDATSPELWSVDGPTALTPNFDGVADRLNLLARFSETVSWSSTIKDADGDVLRTQSGSGFQANLTWDVQSDGALAPDGEYTWNLSAADAAGNGMTDESGPFTISAGATPATGVPTFAPISPLMSRTSNVYYALHFASSVTGLDPSDFTVTGTSAGCVVNPPTGSGADYTIYVSKCGSGTVGLYLNQQAVTGDASAVGPAGPIVGATVKIDKTAPKAVAPKPSLRTGIALETASATQRLLVRIYWSGSDADSGVASYDVQRSYDGAAYTTIASAITSPSLNVTMNIGHTYKFRVRARDAAGNVSAWTTAYSWGTSLRQNTYSSIVYGGSWSTVSSASSSGGSYRAASTAGAKASLTFSGRAVGLVGMLRPDGGAVQVWIDGALAATIDTRSDSVAYRQVLFNRTWTSYGSHTIKLVVAGTAGHPVFALDALEIVR
jgi:hypothetical protein